MDSRINTTWREQRFSIAGKSSKVMYFSDTKPNYFYINNHGAGDLYIGIGSLIPDKTLYDMFIESGGSNLYARGIGTDRIEIYNDSDSESMIKVTSFEDIFTPSSLGASTTLNIAGSGKVEVVSLPALASGANVIGQVIIKPHAGVMTSVNTTVTSGTPVTAAPPTGKANMKINMFSNDGDADITVNVGGVNIVMKAGESFSDLETGDALGTITISTAGTGQAFRLLYTAY
jgi:hypothetical protein